jgi:hypothetical protein
LREAALFARIALLLRTRRNKPMINTVITILTMALPYLVSNAAERAKVLAFLNQLEAGVTAFEAGSPASFTFGPDSVTIPVVGLVSASDVLTIKKG